MKIQNKGGATTFVGKVYWSILKILSPNSFRPDSFEYWTRRYLEGGNSGAGSYGRLAAFKSEIVNDFIRKHEIDTVIEFGCGDGNQLKSMNYDHYTGFDISQQAIERCREIFSENKKWNFKNLSEFSGEKANMTISLDVIYHLLEDDVFFQYMENLFSSSEKFVIIYSSDTDDNRGYEGTHVRHRNFSKWISENKSGWKLIKKIPNDFPYSGDQNEESFAEFYLFENA